MTPARRMDELTRRFLQQRERYEKQHQGDWEADEDNLIPGPSTPPNKASVHFEDIEVTPRPIPRALEVVNDFEIREGGESELEMDPTALLLKTILKRIMALEKRSKTPPPPTKYHNDPALVEKLATLTTKVAELERKFRTAPPLPPATGRPPPGLPATPPAPAAVPKNSWAQVASRKANKPATKTTAPPTPVAPVKRDRTLIITRDCTPIAPTITPLVLRDHINTALRMALIAEVRFTAKLHIQLITITNTKSDHLLKNRTKLEEAIRAILPSATSLQKEVHVVQVAIHNIRTTIPCTTEGFQQVLTEVQTFNPGTTLHRPPRWLTKAPQREGKLSSSMVLSIVGFTD
ncbi:hypothetical protein Q9L58_010499 [Maublancomyces gigas]|uniref:Gag-like protein n=1 Tax=Discina gigas TaxID=1032678 RepID=A0ABR3G3Y7_9PEZI